MNHLLSIISEMYDKHCPLAFKVEKTVFGQTMNN